eukprot:c1718_g1_i1.p1 GENE.c1718_g1_i1~~c1718_g1_i1.p1  ORF type:complete len:522 (+),score=120.56 c1718_g1_i1:33-1598(+)
MKRAGEEWQTVQLTNFPANVDFAACNALLTSLNVELDHLAPVHDKLARDTQAQITQAMDLLLLRDAKKDALIEEWEKIADAYDKKQRAHVCEIAAQQTGVAGTKETARAMKGAYLAGWLGQRGKIMKKVTWKFYVLTSKNFLCYDSEEKLAVGAGHAALTQLTAQMRPRLMIDSEVPGFELSDGRLFICFSKHEALVWYHAINARVAYLAYLNHIIPINSSNAPLTTRVPPKLEVAFRNNQLTAWDVSGVEMDQITLRCLGSLLLSQPNVTCIALNNCRITDDVFKQSEFAEALALSSQLATLSLCNNQISHISSLLLSKVLHAGGALNQLLLDGCPLGDAVQSVLSPLPLQQAPLKHLSLANSNLTATGVQAICRLRLAQDAAIRAAGPVDEQELAFILDVSENLIGDDGAIAIAKHMTPIGFTSVHLTNCGVGPAGLTALFEACQGAPDNNNKVKITELHLTDNEFSAGAYAALTRAVLSNPSLRVASTRQCVLNSPNLDCLRILQTCEVAELRESVEA